MECRPWWGFSSYHDSLRFSFPAAPRFPNSGGIKRPDLATTRQYSGLWHYLLPQRIACFLRWGPAHEGNASWESPRLILLPTDRMIWDAGGGSHHGSLRLLVSRARGAPDLCACLDGLCRFLHLESFPQPGCDSRNRPDSFVPPRCRKMIWNADPGGGSHQKFCASRFRAEANQATEGSFLRELDSATPLIPETVQTHGF